MAVEKLKSYPVTNTEFTKAVFTLEGGKAITDVIDTTAKKTPFLEFYSESDEGERQIYGLILEIKAGSAPVEDENAPVVAGATGSPAPSTARPPMSIWQSCPPMPRSSP